VIGRLSHEKGQDLLLRALERLAPARRPVVVFAGDGPERARLASAGRHTGAVEWTGAVASREVPGLLTSMDVAAAPYPAGEDFYFSPLKILEYMAAGLPVVASRIGQIADVVSHQDTGLLCEPGDTAALAATVLELFADAAKRRRIGRAAARRVREAHTWRATARRILMLADGLRRIPGARAMAGT
jgi:glycosyltransferase involved in cell wall biosynthesis